VDNAHAAMYLDKPPDQSHKFQQFVAEPVPHQVRQPVSPNRSLLPGPVLSRQHCARRPHFQSIPRSGALSNTTSIAAHWQQHTFRAMIVVATNVSPPSGGPHDQDCLHRRRQPGLHPWLSP
jgi:hypothetical protein